MRAGSGMVSRVVWSLQCKNAAGTIFGVRSLCKRGDVAVCSRSKGNDVPCFRLLVRGTWDLALRHTSEDPEHDSRENKLLARDATTKYQIPSTKYPQEKRKHATLFLSLGNNVLFIARAGSSGKGIQAAGNLFH